MVRNMRLGLAVSLALGLIGGLLWGLSEDAAAIVEERAGEETSVRAPLGTEVSGPISSDTTWDMDGSPYQLTADVTVNPDVTLTIEPGVIVKGGVGKDTTIELKIQGYLEAIGEPNNPITFTSYQDSGVGQWAGLIFDGGTGNLRHTVVRYGGGDVDAEVQSNIAIVDVLNGMVSIQSSDVRVDNLNAGTFTPKLTYGIYITDSHVAISNTHFVGDEAISNADYALYAGGATALLTATHNVFSNTQGYAVRIPPALINSVTNNTFSAGAASNGRCILIDGAALAGNATLTPQDGLEGYELAQSLEIPDGLTLTIEPGIAVMGKDELLVRGHLAAIGNATKSITLTSASNSGAGEWGGLIFDGGTGDLQYATVRYGGVMNSLGVRSNIAISNVLTGMIRIQHSAVMTENQSGISSRPDYGIYLANSHVLISDTLFLENGNNKEDYALYVAGDQAVLTVTGNVFADTGGYAVRIPPALIESVGHNQFSGGETEARRILIEGADILTDTILTAQTGLLGYELGTTLEVMTDATLTVEPGIAVMGKNELMVRGHLDAIGSAADPITFTSAQNSTSGQWAGLVFDGGTGDLQYTTVRYAGKENSLGVQSNVAITNTLTGEVSIAHSRIISENDTDVGASRDHGIYLMNSRVVIANTDLYDNGEDGRMDIALYINGAHSVVTVTGSTLRNNGGTGIELNQGDLAFLCSEVSGNGNVSDNQGDGLRINSGSLFVLGSGLFGNVGFDLVNNTGGQIDARENWWGDSDPSDQIDGDEVMYEPVLPAFVCVTELELTQTDAPYDPILAGEYLTYTIAVTNIGPSPLSQLVISDTLDAGVHYISGAVSQGTGCTEAITGVVTCDLGAMDIGQTETATVQVKTDVVGVITNVVVALSEGRYPLALPITETTTLDSAADVRPSIQGTPNPAAEGFPLTYTVAVYNDGPATAQDVTLTYTWPTTVAFASLAPEGDCERNGNAMTCDWGAMERDAVVSATVVVTPTEKGWLQSQAEVSSSTADWNPGNETTTYEMEVAPASDLSVTMGLAPDLPNYVLSPLTYTIVVTNYGPDALAAVVRDTLPVSATFLSASAGCGDPVGGVVTCTLGAMEVDAQKTLTVAVMAPAEVMTLTNHVEVIAEGADPWQRNNIAELDTPLAPKADLRVTALDAPATVALYAPLTYTIEISNAGPSAAMNVRLTDTLPANVKFSAVTPAECSYDEGEDLVTCDWGELAPGAGMSVTVVSTATRSGAAENTVIVAAAEHDHVAGNNTRSVSTEVAPAVDLRVTLSDDPDPVTAGERLTYTLIVANAGPDAATGVALTATLPTDVVYDSTETIQGTFSASPGVITYSLGAIQAGDAVTATIYVTVNPGARGTLEVSATAIAAEAELDAGNNRDIVETTTVNAAADLSVGLIQTTETVTAGQQFTYTVAVTNGGPSTALGVVLTDTLPSALSYVGAEVSLAGGSCQAADVGITCTLGALDLHQTAWVTMTLSASVDVDASGWVTSAIAAASLEADPVLENNTLDIPTLIIASEEGGGTIYLPLVMRSSSP
ncbi:MAG: hypothetical protein ACLFTI_01710 [Anaerolineales bacterium]